MILASAARFLIDGHEEDAASLLLACTLDATEAGTWYSGDEILHGLHGQCPNMHCVNRPAMSAQKRDSGERGADAPLSPPAGYALFASFHALMASSSSASAAVYATRNSFSSR